jgi:hypothetical protein
MICSIQAQTKVGEEVTINFQNPYLYKGNTTNTHKMVWSKEIIQDFGNDLPPNALPSDGCPDNITITHNVLSGQTDIQEAKHTIIATNVIFSGGVAAYNAGGVIHLKTGFSAKSGSSFRAYIEGCSAKKGVREELTNQEEAITYENINLENNALEELEVIKVHPNPTKGIVTIDSKKQIASWKLKDYIGRYTEQSKLRSNSFYKDQFNINHLPTGLYILKITLTNGDVIYKNIVKN